ncbi:MAG: 3'-5' exonuclease [Akkermansiaceae bacterium]|nr:3'-5' exonuclease [Akkermansiaceae bacterium]
MGALSLDQPISQLAFAAVDFESAGAAPGETDQPIQVGIVRVESLYAEAEVFTSYLACARPVRWSASRVHGITTEQLRGAPSLLSLWGSIRRLLSGCVVVGHNPSTEQRFLRAFPAHGFGPWLDTLALARKCLPDRRDFALGAVCEALELRPAVEALVPGKSWHDALFDAAGSLELLRAVVSGLQLQSRPLRCLDFAVKC